MKVRESEGGKRIWQVGQLPDYLKRYLKMTLRQIERLCVLVNDEWVDEDDGKASEAEFKRLINEIESSQELHIFAACFNWDCGWEELETVFESPLCDRGTALMIYWRSQPDYTYRQLEKAGMISVKEKAAWDRTKSLEKRLVNDEFPLKEIMFSPEEDLGRTITAEDKYRRGIRFVPKSLWSPSPGKKIDFDSEKLWR